MIAGECRRWNSTARPVTTQPRESLEWPGGMVWRFSKTFRDEIFVAKDSKKGRGRAVWIEEGGSWGRGVAGSDPDPGRPLLPFDRGRPDLTVTLR
jgi:hypothetical protein